MLVLSTTTGANRGADEGYQGLVDIKGHPFFLKKKDIHFLKSERVRERRKGRKEGNKQAIVRSTLVSFSVHSYKTMLSKVLL